MTNTVPVTFQNKDGCKLFGVLHKPLEDVNKGTAIIILSPGIKSRVAPHRLYIKMARRFVDMGFHVLRFDFYGLGDSEGEVDVKFVADFYGSIEAGRYIDDTISAMNWMENEHRISRFILTGLCGGAITGLLTGAKDKRVCALLSLGMTVIISSASIDPNTFITEGQLRDYRNMYLINLFKMKSLLRFITFRSDYRLILKSIIRPGRKKLQNSVANLKASQSLTDASSQPVNNLNPHFPMALHAVAAARKIYLIFSEADRLFWEFDEKYRKKYEKEFEKYRGNISIDIIINANHIFSFTEWQKEMLDKSCLWLKTNTTELGGKL